jgi:hypothetical protein
MGRATHSTMWPASCACFYRLAQIDGSPAELGASPWHPSVLDEPASPAILAQAADVPPVRDSARVICGCRDHGQGRAPADLEP